MKKGNLFYATFVMLFISVFSSCTTENVDTNLAEDVIGTYSFDSYQTQDEDVIGNVSSNKLIVTRVDDTHIKIVLDYSNPDFDDLVTDNAFLEKDGSNYNFSQSFSNAELTGEIIGNSMTYYIIYSDEDFVSISASK